MTADWYLRQLQRMEGELREFLTTVVSDKASLTANDVQDLTSQSYVVEVLARSFKDALGPTLP